MFQIRVVSSAISGECVRTPAESSLGVWHTYGFPPTNTFRTCTATFTTGNEIRIENPNGGWNYYQYPAIPQGLIVSGAFFNIGGGQVVPGSCWNLALGICNNESFIELPAGTPIQNLFGITVSGTSQGHSFNFPSPPSSFGSFEWTIVQGGFYWPPTPTQSLRIRGGLSDGAMAPIAGRPSPVAARVPLGAQVTFDAIDNSGAPVPSTFSPSQASLSGVIDNESLFRDFVLHPYAATNSGSRTFQAVHLGTVIVQVNSAIGNATISVQVENPSRLGTEAGSDVVNADVLTTANRTGVLPQFIKAHVAQESYPRWNRLTYRYEPISRYGEFMISYRENLREQAPYSFYRLAAAADVVDGATRPALNEGLRVVQGDRDARRELRVGCNSTSPGTPIGAGSTQKPTIYELYICNEAVWHWYRYVNDDDEADKRIEQARTSGTTAQTSLAASFGLLQVTTGAAVALGIRTNEPAPRSNPSLMFDTPENIAVGGHSLLWGTRKIRGHLLKIRRQGVASFAPQEHGELIQAFLNAWGKYNARDGYGSEVLNRVNRYWPIPQTTTVIQ
jgi:hypothetical protein